MAEGCQALWSHWHTKLGMHAASVDVLCAASARQHPPDGERLMVEKMHMPTPSDGPSPALIKHDGFQKTPDAYRNAYATDIGHPEDLELWLKFQGLAYQKQGACVQ